MKGQSVEVLNLIWHLGAVAGGSWLLFEWLRRKEKAELLDAVALPFFLLRESLVQPCSPATRSQFLRIARVILARLHVQPKQTVPLSLGSVPKDFSHPVAVEWLRLLFELLPQAGRHKRSMRAGFRVLTKSSDPLHLDVDPNSAMTGSELQIWLGQLQISRFECRLRAVQEDTEAFWFVEVLPLAKTAACAAEGG